jgi:hypothetical protein
MRTLELGASPRSFILDRVIASLAPDLDTFADDLEKLRRFALRHDRNRQDHLYKNNCMH